MKTYLVFILLLLASCCPAWACGYYPYGEDVRFSMYKPDLHLFAEYADFYYSTHYYEQADAVHHYAKENIDCTSEAYENIMLWSKRYKQRFSAKQLLDAIYTLERKDLTAVSSNAWINYLFSTKDSLTIAYLDFAMSCQDYNTRFEDPWERYAFASSTGRTKMLVEAEKRMGSLTDQELVRRYAFLCIRLAHYNDNKEKIRQVYEKYFASGPKDPLYYWSMSFLCFAETAPAKINYYAAQVFAYCPGKRFIISQQYIDSIAVSETLQWATTPDEKAAVYLLAGIKNPSQVLDGMERLYAEQPISEGLSFLLLRELNKLEDWIYTPYYTDFSPALSNVNTYEDNFYLIYHQRLATDRAYAKKVLAFVNRALKGKTDHPAFWKNAKAYLLLMTEQYAEGRRYIETLLANPPSDSLLRNKLEMLYAYCLTAEQRQGQAVLLPEVKQQILQQVKAKNYRFVFAIARELEFKGNTTDAAVLLSNINQSELPDDDESWRSDIFWRTKHGSYVVYGNFYTSYFDYIDFAYTPAQVNQLIQHVKHRTTGDAFDRWAYPRLKKELHGLYDLLGTKYIRQNKLTQALHAFKQLPDTTTYEYLDANPFYTNTYNEHRTVEADTITYNKYTLTKKLIEYINKANHPKTKDRDYYYFLVANCYLNMTYYGNSWYMKRYYWSSSIWLRDEYNDEDYGQCLRAKAYYLKAKEYSQTPPFAALCLRMAGRCEKYRLLSIFKQNNRSESPNAYAQEKIFNINRYYIQLKTDYPNYYDDLISNCESFDQYFKMRRPS